MLNHQENKRMLKQSSPGGAQEFFEGIEIVKRVNRKNFSQKTFIP